MYNDKKRREFIGVKNLWPRMASMLLAGLLVFSGQLAMGQETIYPAAKHNGKFIIKNATIHVGNGQVLTNASLHVTNDKITGVGTNLPEEGAAVIDATGKHVYPGLILSNSQFGLREIGSGVRGSNDFNELGTMNAGVQVYHAYNAESKLLNVVRSNGILLANVVPVSALVAGESAVMQLDAWNWEDALYKPASGMHVYLPSLLQRPPREGMPDTRTEQRRQALDRIESLKKYLRDAKAYLNNPRKEVTNINLEAARPLFEKRKSFLYTATL